MEFSNHIERITLTLNSPISLQPLNCFTNLKELNIQLLHCNLGSSGRVQIPNLTKVSLTIEGNELTSLDPISLPYTVRELALNFASNRLAFESLRVIETSLSKLLLKSLVLNFNGYSLSSNQIFDEGIECNKLGLNYLYIITRRQQLRKFHLGLGRCGLTDVGVQYSLIPMIETQRKLKYLKLDLFSNQITRLEPLEYVGIGGKVDLQVGAGDHNESELESASVTAEQPADDKHQELRSLSMTLIYILLRHNYLNLNP